MIKNIVNLVYAGAKSAVRKAGYELTVTRSGSNLLFDTARVQGLANDTTEMRLYYESLAEVGQLNTDNIYKRMRFYVLAQLADYAATHFMGLDIVECGCWHGHSTLMIAKTMAKNNFSGQFHVFDSFEGGLSDFRPEDDGDNPIAGDEKERIRRQFESHLSDVTGRLKNYEFTKFYKGWIPERFNEVSDRQFCFANIDVDLYQPTYDSMEFIYPRLVDGGAIFFDDYGCANFPGCKIAVDKYLSKQRPRLFVALPSMGAILIK